MAVQSIAQLVDQQVQRWEASRGKSQEVASPCIAIGRMPSAGGTTLGQRLSKQLGYGMFGREIVEQIAKEEGVKLSLVEGMDEHAETSIQRHLVDSFSHRQFTESDYLKDVVQIVTTLGQRGHAVIVGRGAPYILPADRCLRVLVVASAHARAEWYGARHGLDAREAARRLVRQDDQRERFLRQDFNVFYLDPSLYDVVVNTETLGLDAAAEIVIEAYRRRFPA